MTHLLSHRLALLNGAENVELLRQCRHGLEKESLRVDRRGQLALSPHAQSLGSALTHPQITTDYSEALLEFITAAREQPADTLDELDAIHRYVYAQLDDELLWCQSMPCKLPEEALIPIARYGSSHTGQIKHVYRKGLAVRYGKAMQCIAGIHYNFSLPDQLWQRLQQDDGDTQTARDYQSARYIALIRNFRRYNWLLMYLFGASPAVSSDFLRGRAHELESFDADSLYLPFATSLRMSGLGYQSDAQASIQPCYNCLPSYLDNLRQAVSTPYPPYQAFGTHRDGEWLQLNTNVLQIENEYYSSIRPKRVTDPGERPIQALGARGVQYVEVRCMDINPFLPVGIDLGTARFLDTFLLYCALEDSPKMSSEECSEITDNLTLAVTDGRRPGLALNQHGNPRDLAGWGLELLERMAPCAGLLDKAYGNVEHQQALIDAGAKLQDPDLTPSARMLNSMRKDNIGFLDFALRESARHADWFRARPLDPSTLQAFEQVARDSIAKQEEMEREQQGDFADYVASYMAGINPIE